VIPVDAAGDVRLDAYEAMLGPRVKLVALPHVSNTIGTIVPVALMTEMAHRHGARVLVDGAQSVAHLPVDLTNLGADFLAFSGHKIYGPTGIGVLYGREDVLNEMPPWQGGGSMIEDVTFERGGLQTFSRRRSFADEGGAAVGVWKAAAEPLWQPSRCWKSSGMRPGSMRRAVNVSISTSLGA